MKNGKVARSFEQMLGLVGAASNIVSEDGGIKVHRYTGVQASLCKTELTDTHAPLVNGISNNIARLLRRTIPLTYLGLASSRSFYAFYAEPDGSLQVGRIKWLVATERGDPNKMELARKHFRALEEAFGRSGLRLERMTVRFARTPDGRLLVSSLFELRDWVLWRGVERVGDPDSAPSKLADDYKKLNTISADFVCL
ncbi:MAG: hypothetical protein V4474_00635 [Patescibacteria group bacterium]